MLALRARRFAPRCASPSPSSEVFESTRNFPEPHAWHDAADGVPFPEYFPGSQSPQIESEFAPSDSLNFPALQSEQVAFDVALMASLNFPALQGRQVDEPSSGLNFPASQSEQAADPVDECVPLSHSRQKEALLAPIDKLNLPAVQSEQEEAPGDPLNLPASHSLHFDSLFAPEKETNLPVSQALHPLVSLSAPKEVPYLPGVHEMQVDMPVAPTDSENEPFTHEEQKVAPAVMP